MGKQARVSKATVRAIRVKIRTVVKKNREWQTKLNRHLEFVNPTDKQARTREHRIAYSSLIRRNKALSDAARAIFDSMKSG
jgi:hypothetical protein